jgi:hypothetical protein
MIQQNMKVPRRNWRFWRSPAGGGGHEHRRTTTQSPSRELIGPTGPELGRDECSEQHDRYVEFEVAGADVNAAIDTGDECAPEGCSA